MSLMKKFKEDVIRINDIADIYKILSEMIEILTSSLKPKIDNKQESLTSFTEAEYQSLEKLVQKHEAEIRNHIRTE